MQRVEDEPEIMDEFSKAYRWYRDKYIKSNLKEGVLYAEPGFDSVSQQIFQNNNQVNLKVNTQYDILRRWYSFKYVDIFHILSDTQDNYKLENYQMTEESHSGSWSVENSYNNITKEDLKHIVTPQQYLHFIRTDATNAKVQRRVQIREIPAVQFTGYDDLGSDEF